MSESNPMLQLSIAPSAPEPETAASTDSIQQAASSAAAPEAAAPKLDESQLTDAEKKAIDDFIQKVDITNPDHVLLFGADAQKRIADFSENALATVKTQDTGEVGNMLVNLVAELKGFQKVLLQAGESQDVTITIDREALAFYNETTHQWEVEPGLFEAKIGTSSDKIAGTVKFQLK